MMTLFPTEIFDAAEKTLSTCRARSLEIATAESCTGGLIAAALTEIPGSSDVFVGGFVSYANYAKRDWLNVPADLLKDYGAVSEPVVRAMAEGALLAAQTDLAIAVSGVAGPGGGSADKPVGHVCFALAQRGEETQTETRQFGAIGRDQVRLETVRVALALLMRGASRKP
jgi:nicotinamide-nucleotide amidase